MDFARWKVIVKAFWYTVDLRPEPRLWRCDHKAHASLSRSTHPRGKSRSYRDHLRKDREWKRDSMWKPGERPRVDEKPRSERRSPRTRLK